MSPIICEVVQTSPIIFIIILIRKFYVVKFVIYTFTIFCLLYILIKIDYIKNLWGKQKKLSIDVFRLFILMDALKVIINKSY